MKVVIIGAGLGGLATACRLAKAGHAVTVLEQDEKVGGRCNTFSKDGYTFDTGPSLLMMLDALKEFYTTMGTSLEKELDLIRMQPNYQIRFDDKTVLTLTSDLADMLAQLERFEQGSSKRFMEFLSQSKKDYRIAWKHFINRNYDGVLDMVKPSALLPGLQMNALGKLYSRMSLVFNDPRLRAAFTFQSMYLGTSPYESPAVYSILTHTELMDGIYFPKGGMYKVAESLEKLARTHNVTIRTRTPVQRIIVENNKASGVLLQDGTTLVADVIISNVDLPTTYERFLGRKKEARKLEVSSSCLLLYLGATQQFPRMLHHTVRLSGDYKQTFDDLFKRKTLPTALNYYVCIPTMTDPSLAPPGCSSMMVLLPVPNLEAPIDWTTNAPILRDRLIDSMEKDFGMKGLRESLVVSEMMTPDDFERRFGMHRGSAFGVSHGLFQSAAFRPNNVDPRIKNLYYVGASTNPGSGVPMVFIASKLVAERIL